VRGGARSFSQHAAIRAFRDLRQPLYHVGSAGEDDRFGAGADRGHGGAGVVAAIEHRGEPGGGDGVTRGFDQRGPPAGAGVDSGVGGAEEGDFASGGGFERRDRLGERMDRDGEGRGQMSSRSSASGFLSSTLKRPS